MRVELHDHSLPLVSGGMPVIPRIPPDSPHKGNMEGLRPSKPPQVVSSTLN